MTELRHGYTLAELDRLAVSAAANNHSMAADFSDAHHAALSAIVDVLYAADQPPSRHDLSYAGKAAVWKLVRDHRQTYGYRDRDPYAGIGSAPHFAAYWSAPTNSNPSAPFEERVLERLTLGKVWPQLSDQHRQVLAALAVYDDYRDAAAALGMPDSSYRTYVSQARRALLSVWHDHETPRRQTGYNRRRHRVPVQPCGTPAAYDRHKAHKEPVDPACAEAARRRDRTRKRRAAA